MKRIVQYQCETCLESYDTKERARRCEAQKDEAKFKAGDIVLAGAGFGWYDGDKIWISNPEVLRGKRPCPRGSGNCFAPCCTYRFYYVVTLVDRGDDDPHRVRYHIETMAMTGKEGHRAGWTYNKNHRGLEKPEGIPAIVAEQGRTLIGNKSRHLL